MQRYNISLKRQNILLDIFRENAAYACENRYESVFLMFCFCVVVFVTATAYGQRLRLLSVALICVKRV